VKPPELLTAPAATNGKPPVVEEEYRELLTLDGISKSWGALRVLDDVDLVLPKGALTWVGGPNGIGKTTLLRIAAGLIGPDAGLIDLEGLHPWRNRKSFQRRIGFLSAGDRGLYARLTVRAHLLLWAKLALLRGAALDEAVERMVDRLALEELMGRRVDRISMGQRQRVRLAMAFLHDPDVVLLDEPLNSLDETGADSLRRCVDEVTGRGGAALWISPGTDRDHIPFDRSLWLEGGKLDERDA
jgi:ABC-2 type transport system ATP-binding protein